VDTMWESLVELRHDPHDLFNAMETIIHELRVSLPTPSQPLLLEREAAMRQAIRGALNEGFNRIAVVCGAWHAPALRQLDEMQEDTVRLRALSRRTRVESAWIPWTNSRLSRRSGYGAGVAAPGWYEYLWLHRNAVTATWLAHVARLLRKEGFDAPPASVQEAVHLSSALAELRNRCHPGLAEFHEATQIVLCHGASEPLSLVRDRLEIGEKQGRVPKVETMVALARDLELQQKRLRLFPSMEERLLDLDLRNVTDLARSRLLYRLHVLDIPWGVLQEAARKAGTFHEFWKLQWTPDLTLRVVEANTWGGTVQEAASACIAAQVACEQPLPHLSRLLELALWADLADAVDLLLSRIQVISVVTTDTRYLIDALLPLARIVRYGDARQTSEKRLIPITDVLFERAIVSLPMACLFQDEDAAVHMVESINTLQECVEWLGTPERQARWTEVLHHISDQEQTHGLVRGRCVRLLLDHQQLDPGELQRRARLVLSPHTVPQQAAAWIEGVVQGSVTLLLHQDVLWQELDTWVGGLEGETFLPLLPLLRRAFSTFTVLEKQELGSKVKHLRRGEKGVQTTVILQEDDERRGLALDLSRANAVLPVLERILEETRHAR